MRKSIFALLLFALFITACSANQFEKQSPDSASQVEPATADGTPENTPQADATALDMPIYPQNFSETMDVSEIFAPPETIFSTPASENGLGDTTYLLSGTIESYNTAQDDPYGYETIVLSTEHGKIMITNLYEALYPEYFDFPNEVGSTASFYAQYTGYSRVEDIACAMLGSEQYFEVVFALNSSDEEATRNTILTGAQAKENLAQEAKEKLASQHYDEIKLGMTLEEVQALTGFDGREISASENALGSLQRYDWEGDHITITVWFKNGVAYEKSK